MTYIFYTHETSPKHESTMDHVQIHFTCKECNTKAQFSPEDMVNNGTPICSECDEDMELHHVEVYTDGLSKV
jgi:transcription elongation factor Elf1